MYTPTLKYTVVFKYKRICKHMGTPTVHAYMCPGSSNLTSHAHSKGRVCTHVQTSSLSYSSSSRLLHTRICTLQQVLLPSQSRPLHTLTSSNLRHHAETSTLRISPMLAYSFNISSTRTQRPRDWPRRKLRPKDWPRRRPR